MTLNIEKLFERLGTIEPPHGLLEVIYQRITAAQIRLARMRLGFFSVLGLGSVAAAYPAIQYAMNGFYQSGFYQYASLLFSDSGFMLTHWQEYFLSLIETLPVMSLIAVLSVLFIFLESLRLAAKNMKQAFS